MQQPVQRVLESLVAVPDGADEDEALALAVQLARELTGADGALSVLQGADGSLTHVHHSGLGDREVALLLRGSPDGPGAVGAVLDGAVVRRLRPADGRTGRAVGVGRPAGVDAVLGVPVVDGVHVLGALHLTRRPSRPAFSADDERLAVVVGRQLGRAVGALRTRWEAARLAGELAVAERVKADALHQLSTELDPRVAIERILAVARANTGMDVAYVSRIGAGRQLVSVVVGDLAAIPLRAGQEGPAADGHCLHVLAGDLPPVIPDTHRDPLSARLPNTAALGIRAYVGVPLLLGREPYGTLCCASATVQERLGAGEHALLQVLSELVGEQLGRAAARDGERARTVDGLVRHLEPGGLVLLAQPIVELSGGRVVGVEALSRFPGHTGSPAEVFASAAELGMGIELELAAVREALALLPRLPDHLYVSVNAAPSTAVDPALVELLEAAPAGRVVLELTEHAAIGDYALLLRSLERLRAHGVRLAVDDTGSGYSSLQHILALAPDVIKLDIALVRGVDQDRARAALVRALTHFAADAGAVLVAEGIESPAELTALRDLGVGLGQGYYLGRPEDVGHLALERPRYVGPERRDRRPWFSAATTVPGPGMPVHRAVATQPAAS